jgi:hypothetical protein
MNGQDTEKERERLLLLAKAQMKLRGQGSQFQTAQSDVTAVGTTPKRERSGLSDVLGSLGRTLSYADPMKRATTDPRQMVSDIGTGLEIGLPFLASPLPPPLRIPLTGLLQGTGTAIKSAAGGAPPGRMLKEAGESALYGIAGQAIGEGLGAATQKTLAPFAKQIDRPALATAKQYGIKPFPSEVINETTTSSNLNKLLEEASSKSLFGAAITKRTRYNNFQALQKYKTDVLDKIAPDTAPTQMKQMVVDAIQGNENAFRNVAQTLYDDVDKAARVTPSVTNVKAFANKVLASIPEQERLAAGKGGTEASALVSQLERVAQLPNNIPFQHAQYYRSQLLTTIRTDKSPIGGQIKGTASKIADLFDSSMNQAAKQSGSDIYSKYRQASEFWRQGKDLFNSDVVASLAKQDPEELARIVFAPRSGENIGRVEAAINPDTFSAIKRGTSPEVWQRFKRAGLENLIESKVFQKVNTQTGDEFLRGANLYETLKSYGNETLNKWLDPTEKQAVMDFAKMASRINTKEPTMGLWGMGQLNAGMIGLGTGYISGDPTFAITSAGLIMGAPALYAKLVTSNVGRRLLTEGYRIRPGTREAMNFLPRFSVYLASQKPTEQPKRK